MMTDILVNAGGILLMVAIVGWFWLPVKGSAKPPNSDSRQ